MFQYIKACFNSLVGRPNTLSEFVQKCMELQRSDVTIQLWGICYSGGFADIGAGDKGHYGAKLLAGKVEFMLNHRISRTWMFNQTCAELIATLDCWREMIMVAKFLENSGFNVSIKGTKGQVLTVPEAEKLWLEYETTTPIAIQKYGTTAERARSYVKTKRSVQLIS